MLGLETRERVRKQLMIDEGLRLKPYRDSVGKLTIGIGRNLDDVGISALEAYDLLDHDIDRAIIQLVGRFPWFNDLNEARQAVMVNWCFNIGIESLSGFRNTLAALRAGDFVAASKGMLASKWARQVGPRATRLARIMLTGEWNE